MTKRTKVSRVVQDKLLVAAMHRCCLCPEHHDVTDLHHIEPISEGGPNTEDNLMVICPTCHAKIHRIRNRYTPGQLRTYKERWERLCALGLPLDARLAQACDNNRPPEPLQLSLVTFPSPDVTVAPAHWPPKAYHRLVGRFNELDQVMSALHEPKRKPMIAVVGLGGIGKTALAREAAERCWEEKLFDYIVLTSSKAEHFVGEGIIIKTRVSDYGFEELLSDIGRQCDRVDVAHMPLDQKQAAVKYLLAHKRVLVVMDNLETVPDSEKLVASLFQILGRSKLLITSRHHVKHDRVFTTNLGGFPEDEGVTFLREDSRERGIKVVTQANRSSLVEIHRVTGGAPLAMKLVVGQISRQPMGVVLETLKQASFKDQDYPFYRFVYQHSWEMLNMDARMALVDMSVFPPNTGGAVDDVQTVSQVKPSSFWPAVEQLVTMSLVGKTGQVGRERFGLHPLTQYFIRSDITKEWADR